MIFNYLILIHYKLKSNQSPKQFVNYRTLGYLSSGNPTPSSHSVNSTVLLRKQLLPLQMIQLAVVHTVHDGHHPLQLG